ncbi:hypothetical protein CC1G_08462 [Coprinopsis cinerea okayama7|uniref:CxC2-like cysteine cluster KDZ transposase-associated domain-containing protein n=1 Tax=Coprinopsis cinerea (strain Okayama-7 / 130 / ATCC MYA-4618 / FGSC 9003) TaxID=240176 RepID=A8NM07_COPC7|nr:hypothetical protein CC1G_08462 [Coprinopsis cinerea okayama7\|eukprot:XP_001834817.2 hypothetical protein CC1G_08462 [Coprinopsis cinerea okayama7\
MQTNPNDSTDSTNTSATPNATLTMNLDINVLAALVANMNLSITINATPASPASALTPPAIPPPPPPVVQAVPSAPAAVRSPVSPIAPPSNFWVYPEDAKATDPTVVKYYVVVRGRCCGVFTDWFYVSDLIDNLRSHCIFRSFRSYEEAWAHYQLAKSRCTVRAIGRNGWLAGHFDSLYGPAEDCVHKRSNVFSFSDASGARTRIRAKTIQIDNHPEEPEEPPPSETEPSTPSTPIVGRAVDIELDSDSWDQSNINTEETNDQPRLDDSEDEEDPVQSKSKRHRNYKNWNKLLEWLPYRSDFLDELLRHDGHGDYLGESSCNTCAEKDCRLFKCPDCWDGCLLTCCECLLNNHRNLPLHRIEEWNGRYFEKTSLSSLGLRVQLGHGGGSCANPLPGPPDFTVFDISGVHSVNIDYCDCLPATLSRPQTAFTFDMLDHFHQLSLQGKVTLYDYYHTIVKRSDFLQLRSVPSRCNDFHRTFRLWRVLMMFKRAGRGNVPNGIAETKEGELAIECPACPHPNKNLPVRWKEAGKLAFLYTLFVAVDANFKLKGKNRGFSDIELLPGLAYFVEENKYQNHLIGYVDESEINTCQSEHDAVVRAAVRCTPGYNVTGAAIVICSRHGFLRPNGVGDLQKGERYCNIDYIVFSALAAVALLQVVITYDIACQWVKNFLKRLGKLPEAIRLNTNETKVTALIPSWHINGHGPDCQVNYALQYTPGAAKTCGDEIEQNFSETNVLGASVREMAPAARHEMLTDQFQGNNARKTVKLKALLAKKFRESAEMRAQQEQAFSNLCLTFTLDKIARWTRMIVDWEKDPKNNPNPYAEVKLETTMQDVRLELAKEDEREEARGVVSAHTTSMTACLVVALDLEEQQRSLKFDLENSRMSTSKQKADLQEKRNGMRRRIARWREVQIVYAPCVAPLLPGITAGEDSEGAEVIKPEDIPLYLPSDLTPTLHQTIPAMTEKERRLREAQADDALSEIRLGRRILTGLTQFKKLHLAGAGNKPNTRVRSLYNRIQAKISKAANRYRRARDALVTINPTGEWTHRLKPLNPGDIRGPGRESHESSSRFIPSWIWQVPRVRREGDDTLAEEELDESLRVEWAKGRARLQRWNEEYQLVQEEMRRSVVYLRWKAVWWEERASHDSFKSDDMMHGARAYAHKQADLCRRLADRFSQHWTAILRKYGELPMWMPWAGYDDGSGAKSTAEPNGGPNDHTHDTNDTDDENDLDLDEDAPEDADGVVDDAADVFEFEIDD